MSGAPTPRPFPTLSRRSKGIALAALLLGLVAIAATQLWDPTAVRGSFDIGGRSLYLECVGEGGPTVVMEAGSGGDHSTWADVVGEVRGSHRTCTYDRANTGESSAAAGVRTHADAVADLHTLLGTANIPPPYILVGHSLGGISMRLFATTHADEVVALILVDATPTTFVEDACAIVDAAQCATFRSDFQPDHNDGIDIAGSAGAIAAAAPLRAMPVVVLVANDHGHDGFQADVRRAFEAMWLGRQQEIADSVVGGRLEAVASGHNIQSSHPEFVIGAIASVAAELGVVTR
jgi:pimeloyl-ACP methyl ester carboxylesterase